MRNRMLIGACLWRFKTNIHSMQIRWNILGFVSQFYWMLIQNIEKRTILLGDGEVICSFDQHHSLQHTTGFWLIVCESVTLRVWHHQRLRKILSDFGTKHRYIIAWKYSYQEELNDANALILQSTSSINCDSFSTQLFIIRFYPILIFSWSNNLEIRRLHRQKSVKQFHRSTRMCVCECINYVCMYGYGYVYIWYLVVYESFITQKLQYQMYSRFNIKEFMVNNNY